MDNVKQGWTLIELLTVVSIGFIMLSIGVMVFKLGPLIFRILEKLAS